MKAISASFGSRLGPSEIQRSITPHIGGSLKAKEGSWKRMGSCMDQLHSTVVAVWHLQRVLSKKRDPFTHALFLEEVMQGLFGCLAQRSKEEIGDSIYHKGVFPGSISSFRCF